MSTLLDFITAIFNIPFDIFTAIWDFLQGLIPQTCGDATNCG